MEDDKWKMIGPPVTIKTATDGPFFLQVPPVLRQCFDNHQVAEIARLLHSQQELDIDRRAISQRRTDCYGSCGKS